MFDADLNERQSRFERVQLAALLGLMLPLLGIGFTPALVAIGARALLPILLNTYAGLLTIPPSVVEAARGMGMREWQVLTRVELPLAVRLAAVAVVGLGTSGTQTLIYGFVAVMLGAGIGLLASWIGRGR